MGSRKPADLRVGDIRAYIMRGRGEIDGRPYWRARRYNQVSGKDETVWTGRATRDEATAALAKLTLQPKSRPQLAEITTVRHLLAHWMGAQRKREDLSPDTIRTRRVHQKHLVRTIGDVRLTRIATCLEEHRDARLRETAAPSTVNREFGTLRMAWRWGERRGYVSGSGPIVPRLDEDSANARRYNHHTPTAREVRQALKHLNGWAHLAVRALWHTGGRLSEVASIRPEDLEERATGVGKKRVASWWVRLDGKTGAWWVPIPSSLFEDLVELADQVPAGRRVWPVTHRTFRSTLGPEHIRRACEKAKVSRFTPHGLRRAYDDRLGESGADPRVWAELTGHSVEVAARKYRKASQAQKLDVAAKIGVSVEGEDVVALDEARRARQEDGP